MNILYKWFLNQIFGSLTMSFVVCFYLIGNIKGFYKPGIEKVFFLFFLYFIFSIILGLPVFLIWLIFKKNKIKKQYKFIFFILSLVLLLISISYYFHFNLMYLISLSICYFPFLLFQFYKSIYSATPTKNLK